MTYFNGSHPHAENYTPVTRIYCDECAETEIPLPPREPGRIGRHWGTEFKWAPYFGGDAKCSKCGKPS